MSLKKKCTCNPAALEADFQNGVDSIPVAGNSPSIGGWILWPPVIQYYERSLNKYLDLIEYFIYYKLLWNKQNEF